MDVLLQANELKKELDLLRPLRKDQEQKIMQKFRLDWNYHSNHIEGNSLSFGETKALILFGITAQGKPLKDHFEITGHDEAIKLIEEVIKNERPLTEVFIREIHTLILKTPYQIDAITPDGAPTKKWINIGQYKLTPNHVKTATGEIFRFATAEETPSKMSDLLDWYKDEKDKQQVEAILLAALFHYKFLRIHPFDDGNGRTARILMNFILMQFGYPPVVIKVEDKSSYISVLQQADADIEKPFIEYIAINLIKSLELMLRGARNESIDEPDDLDKEISLLDYKLRSIGPRIEKVRSEDVLKHFYNQTLRKVIITFYDTVSLFDSFYRKKVIVLSAPLMDTKTVSFDDIGELIQKSFSSLFPREIKITIQHEELNYINFEKYSSSITLLFQFDSSLASISTAAFKSVLMYSHDLSDEDYTNLVREIKTCEKAKIDSFIKQENDESNIASIKAALKNQQ